jgi:hypothetical protein
MYYKTSSPLNKKRRRMVFLSDAYTMKMMMRV